MKLREVCVISLYLLSAQNTYPGIKPVVSGKDTGERWLRTQENRSRYDHELVRSRIPKGEGQEM